MCTSQRYISAVTRERYILSPRKYCCTAWPASSASRIHFAQEIQSEMVVGPSNSTATIETLVAAPLSLLGNVYTAVASMLPMKLSFAQQVHIKIKAEAAVMFAFYALKRVYVYLVGWQAGREARRLRGIEEASTKERKKRKRRRRHKERR